MYGRNLRNVRLKSKKGDMRGIGIHDMRRILDQRNKGLLLAPIVINHKIRPPFLLKVV